MSQITEFLEEIRKDVFRNIDQKKKWSIKIKTLMSIFGFTAVQRVRQSTFQDVLSILEGWNIECS